MLFWRKGYAPFNGLNNDAAKFFNGNHTLKAKEIENFEMKLKSNDTQNVKNRRTLQIGCYLDTKVA